MKREEGAFHMANSNLLSIALKCIPASTGLVRVFNVTNAEILM